MRTLVPTRWPARAIRSFPDLTGMDDRLGRLFEWPVDEGEPLAWMPRVDVEETDDKLTLTAELPGLTGEDVDIEIDGNVLTVKGEKKEERESTDENGRNLRVWERRYGAFTRSFTLPSTVMPDEITADFENGVLTVNMPKTAEAKGRRIQVKTAT